MGMTANQAWRIGAIGLALTATFYLANRFSDGKSGDGRSLVRQGDDVTASTSASAAGPAPGPTGAALWQRTFVASGAGGGARIAGIATDREGNVVVAGSFTGTLSFGGEPLVSAGEDDVFVAKLDRTGKHLWSKRFGGPGYQDATSVAVADDGDVIVAGTLDQKADFGGDVLVSAGMIDLFCARLDANGKHLWSRRFGDEREQEAGAMAVDRDGSVVLVGSYEGTLDFGSGPLPCAGGDDVFVAKLDRTGKEIWSRRFGDERSQKGRAVAIARDGSVVITGSFRGKLALGPTTLASPEADSLFVAKLGANGSPTWARAGKGSAGSLVNPRSITIDGDGAITVGGLFHGSVELAGSVLDDRGGEGAVLVARFDASGTPAWATRFGEGRPIELGGLAPTVEGDIIVVSSPLGVLQAKPRGPTDEVTVTRLDRKGHLNTTRKLGPEPQAGLGIALDPAGRVLLAGGSRTAVEAVAGPLAGLSVDVLELRP